MNFMSDFFCCMRLGLIVLVGEWHWLFKESLCRLRTAKASPQQRQSMQEACAAWRAAQLEARKPYLLNI